MVVEQTDETLASCSPINRILTDPYTLTSSRVLSSTTICHTLRKLPAARYYILSARQGGRMVNAAVLMVCLDRCTLFGTSEPAYAVSAL